MNIEKMIYVYLVICVGMILFNIVSAFLSRRRDKRILRVSNGFEDRIRSELIWLETHSAVHSAHKNYLSGKLKRISNMRAFDAALEKKHLENPTLVRKYLYSIGSVFVSLSIEYCKKDSMEAAYFPYIIKKYRILADRPFDAMIDILFRLLHEPSIYCRENAMQALYTIGDASCIVKALKIIDNENKFYHSKLLTDGLLNFAGNTQRLNAALWETFEDFSREMQITLLNYFRFSSGDHCEDILRLMKDTSQDDELRFACIRYFGKYRYEPAYEYLLLYANSRTDMRWEYAAIASSVLASYPSEKTVEILKSNLYHRNWHIRFNSAQSLERLGLTYLDLIDVLEGHDRYASEILRYHFDVRDMIRAEKEDASIC